MAYIKDYWSKKGIRMDMAISHTKEMEEKFSDEIKASIRDTIIYSPEFECKKATIEKKTGIIICDLDSVSAIMEFGSDNRTAVLNFSSYLNPGGRFIDGSKAQEECLCHESFLYNVLKEISEFYEWNAQHKNKALYMNRGLYTYNVRFESGKENCWCDVITCAAPNKSAAQKLCNISDSWNRKVLESRIKFVLDIAKDNGVNTLILGAYGCGVFGQDPIEVASIFKNLLQTTHKCFETVVFAIPAGRDGNLEQFRKVFK